MGPAPFLVFLFVNSRSDEVSKWLLRQSVQTGAGIGEPEDGGPKDGRQLQPCLWSNMWKPSEGLVV